MSQTTHESFDPLLRVKAAGEAAQAETRAAILGWIDSNIFQEAIKAFGWEDDRSQPLSRRVDELVRLSDEWDFRRRTARSESMGASAESTRWTSNSELLGQSQLDVATRAGDQLGLSRESTPAHDSYRAVLVLGGARLSCLLRTQWADEVLQGGRTTRDIVLLGGERPVADSERDATDTYAPHAQTEFDLFVAAAHSVFGVDSERFQGEQHVDDHPNLSWEVREYDAEPNPRVVVMSAPSSDPSNRRANSADTYKFFIERNHLSPGERLLLVTSPIYVPYQQLEAIRVITVPLGIHVETVGFPPTWHAELQGMQGPQHYLQEMRSFLQSSQRFLSAYPG